MPNIKQLKEEYKGEWLAVDIKKEDITGPLEGEVVYRSKDRSEVWLRIKGDRRRLYVTYAGPLIEEGYAVAFNTH